MTSMATLIFVLLLFILHDYPVYGGMSTEENSMLERELKSSTKEPLKTIKTREGDTIDCINIYNQPTLTHPLLKNHKIKMRPTSFPKESSENILPPISNKHASIIPGHIDCPEGTIPIRRTQKEDLIRGRSFLKKYAAKAHPLTKITPNRHQAIVKSIPDPRIKYKGVEATLNTYNPSVRFGQTTFSKILIENGPRNARNSLQSGWMVSSEYYGDNRTRNFIYWNVGEKGKPGCFNHDCPMFIQTQRNYALGGPISVSTYGSRVQIEFTLRIFQDSRTGDWWLVLPAQNIYIGYWPKVLLPQLANGASQVVWGGEAISSLDGRIPEMGSGHFPDGSYYHGCYIRQMKIIDIYQQLVDLAGPKYRTETFVDNPNCYRLSKYGYDGPFYGYYFNFGGPGGNNCGSPTV